ncbi:unnamed protein product [Withania somnifera]
MKALRVLRTFHSSLSSNHLNSTYFLRFYSAQPQQDNPTGLSSSEEDDTSSSVFDSSQYDVGFGLNNDVSSENSGTSSTWDEKYRERVKSKVFGEDPSEIKSSRILIREEEKRRKAALLAKKLLEVAIEQPDDDNKEEDEVVKEEDQMSLSVGIIGAPNAGKSSLTNYMVGTKVSAVSRKMNTTTHEVLGVMTKGKTQIQRILEYLLKIGILELQLKIFTADFHLKAYLNYSKRIYYYEIEHILPLVPFYVMPDSRVVRLIERMGYETNPKQKRLLCINKVDLIEKKKDLLKVAEEFKDLPGYERCFTISGLKGAGVKDLTKYLMEQALKRPWDEDPFVMSEEVMKNISLEVVREKLLHYIHQEIPYGIDHHLMDWKELRDGSLRIEQHLITHKISQRKILVGKNGSKIGRIGLEANEELRTIFKRNVHLILMVRVKS